MKQPDQDDIDILRNIMSMQDALGTKKSEIKESVSHLAQRLNTKAARVNSLIKLVRAEEADPGTIEFEKELLTNVEKVTS